MGKKASTREIEDWRDHYWELTKHSSNKEIAEKIGVDPAYLSRIARGAPDKNGKPKNPGSDFLKKFYMAYPDFPRSPAGKEKHAGSQTNEYDHEKEEIDPAEEARILYMNRTGELLDRLKTSEDFLQGGLKQMLQICATMSETQKESVINQGLMIKTHDKMVDTQRDMTSSIRLWAETNRDLHLESREKIKNPKGSTTR